MGLFKRDKPVEELDEDLERIKVEDEILTKKAEMAEKEAIISQLKAKYGSGWARILGVNKLTDLTTLRSFLKSTKQGMERATSTSGSPLSTALNPANFRGIRKA